MQRVSGKGLLRVAAVGLLCLSLATGGGGESLAQAKEWWDLYDEAKRIVEKDDSSRSELNRAKKNLRQALQAKNTPGKQATYNPSVRIDYLPYFFMGWVNLRLGNYDEAARNFDRSDKAGFINKGAPDRLKSRFQSLSQLVSQLKPASQAVDQAKKSDLASQCRANGSSTAGRTITEALSKLEGMIASPSDGAAMKQWTDTLNDALGACATEIRGAQLAQVGSAYQASRDAIAVEGIGELVQPGTATELQNAVAAGDRAEASGDESGLRTATRSLDQLASKVRSETDRTLGRLVRDSESLVQGNEAALNQQGQVGTRLVTQASQVKGMKAAGKSGADLAAVVKAGVDLKGTFEQADGALRPILQAKTAALESARTEFEQWRRSSSCDINVAEAGAGVDAALRQADSARSGGSADAMDLAVSRLQGIRDEVTAAMRDALPRKERDAQGMVGTADSLIANLPDPTKKTRGESLKKSVQDAVSRKDVCAIDSAIASLQGWIQREGPQLDQARRQAIARNQATLDSAQNLLNGFGGILKPETVASLQGPTRELADLVKVSYDAGAIDKAGNDLEALVGRANGEVKGQMEAGIQALKRMKESPRWSTDVSPERRSWLDRNLAGIERAVSNTSNPNLLARFAREYPRARLEIALVESFSRLYENDDAAGAAKVLEDLGPGLRAGSAALNYALSYCYWWQDRANGEGGQGDLMQKARAAYEDGRALRVELASLGASLFAPAFVTEMTGP